MTKVEDGYEQEQEEGQHQGKLDEGLASFIAANRHEFRPLTML
jgi:hypothetical protein